MENFESCIKRLRFDAGRKGKMMDLGTFHLYCQETLGRLGLGEFCWSKQASKALMQVVEDYLIQLFEDSNYCAQHCCRITLQVRDVQLARRIRSRFECFIGSSILNN